MLVAERRSLTYPCAPLHYFACWWSAHGHFYVPLVTERCLWSFRPPTPKFFLCFCADRFCYPRAMAQHSFGGWGGMRAKKNVCVPEKGPSFLALHSKRHVSTENIFLGLGGWAVGLRAGWVRQIPPKTPPPHHPTPPHPQTPPLKQSPSPGYLAKECQHTQGDSGERWLQQGAFSCLVAYKHGRVDKTKAIRCRQLYGSTRVSYQ